MFALPAKRPARRRAARIAFPPPAGSAIEQQEHPRAVGAHSTRALTTPGNGRRHTPQPAAAPRRHVLPKPEMRLAASWPKRNPVFWPARQERGCRAATLSGALAERRAPRGKQRGFDKLPLFSGGRTSQIPGKDEAALHWAADAQRPVTGMRDLL